MCNMKETNRQNSRNRQKKRPERDASGPHSDSPMESYTPAQLRTIRKGMRILAKVAIRAHMRRRARRPETERGGGEGQRDDFTNEGERRSGV